MSGQLLKREALDAVGQTTIKPPRNQPMRTRRRFMGKTAADKK